MDLIEFTESSLTWPRIFRWLKGLVISAALLSIVTYIIIAVLRMGYKYELELLEGGMADEVAKVLESGMPYRAPSVDFVPFLYGPLYFYLSAAFSSVLGLSFLPLRLLSFLSSLGCFALTFLIVKRHTRDLFSSILAVGMFAATYRASGAWFDVARVDSLFLVLFLLFVSLCDPSITKTRSFIVIPVFAGVIGALSFFVKQTALVVSFPIVGFWLFHDWRRGIVLVISMTVAIVLPTLLLNLLSDGWFSYYQFEMLRGQTLWIPGFFLGFWKTDLLQIVPFALLFALIPLVEAKKVRGQSTYFAMVLAGAVLGSYLSKGKAGGYVNVLMPMYAIICLLLGVGIGRLFGPQGTNLARPNLRMKSLICLGVLFQFFLLAYNPRAQIPSNQSFLATESFFAQVSLLPGEVYIPFHGFVSRYAGKRSYAHQSAILDVLRIPRPNRGREILEASLISAIQNKRFQTIILHGDQQPPLPDLWKHYQMIETPIDSMPPLLGMRSYPSKFLVPRSE